MDRRNFIKKGAIGLAGVSVLNSGLAEMNISLPNDALIDKVPLGNTGMTVSRLAMGTGTVGFNHESNQTRLGMDNFVKLVHRAYERGIRFYDMADAYGSQPFVGAGIKALPRENITILTKMFTQEDKDENKASVPEIINRFRKEIGVEYIDVLLMHCMMSGGWSKTRTYYMDAFSKAKQDGIVKAVGVSCHNIDALREASESAWVDVILARINPFGSVMDGSPDEIKNIIGEARKNGKGIVGMKIFGEGKHVSEEEREQSLKFAIRESNVNCMTLGLESVAQIDDAVDRVIRLSK
ncbi:MAG: aldo/keto reductase [Tannerella sp.]|jgi:aryl-alcohol dehydrogenase-like predicted oxidoreductase|nr:aldo/keto reductase [Tannerella sp.]